MTTATAIHIHEATICRECGQEMETIVQPGARPDRPATPLVTCWNEDCPLCGYTLSASTYGERDLTPYLKGGGR